MSDINAEVVPIAEHAVSPMLNRHSCNDNCFFVWRCITHSMLMYTSRPLIFFSEFKA